MPLAVIASRSNSSSSSDSCSSAISPARSARKVGVAKFAGRFCRSRAELAALAATAARARPRRRPRRPARATRPRRRRCRSSGLEAVERVELEQRALDQPGRDAVALGRGPGQRDGAQLLGAPRRRGGGDARALGVELVAPAQPGDQHAALAAARRVLVGDGDLLEAALRLAEVDQALEPLVGEAPRPRRGRRPGCRRRCPRGRRCGSSRGSGSRGGHPSRKHPARPGAPGSPDQRAQVTLRAPKVHQGD